MESIVVGGVEGGSTCSTALLLNGTGKLLSKVSGPCTNHLLLGMSESRKRIADVVNRAKLEAGIPEDEPLTALGLSLSGCESESTNQVFIKGFAGEYPNLSKQYVIGSDTQGSVRAISNKGGIACIAGTGSNTLLLNPDGSVVRCGGWEYHLGDEGSAYKIAHQAIKTCYDDLDNFVKSPHPISSVWSLIKSHFNIVTQCDLLNYFHTEFSKANIAALCKKLAECANDGDQLSKSIFYQAGKNLAQSLTAVIPKASPELTNNGSGGLQVVCVGSVWLSWNLLRDGFVSFLDNHCELSEMSLVKLTTSMAVGAAYMAADRFNVCLPREYEKNYEVFYRYRKNKIIMKE